MDLKSLDAATDYRAVLAALFGNPDIKGEGAEVYIAPPMRPDEGVERQRFSVNLANGLWKDHKTGESGNMLTLAKEYGPEDWRDRWVEVCPNAAKVLKRQRSSTTSGAVAFDLPEDILGGKSQTSSPPSASGSGSMFQAAAAVTAKKRETKARKGPKKLRRDQQTFAQKAEYGQRKTSEKELQPFCDEWSVSLETLTKSGAWAFAHTTGPLAGEPQLHFPMFDPATGKTVGIKSRALQPLFKRGDDLLKSKNMKGSKIGLFPWHSDLGSKPLLLVEGEKDWAVAQEEFGDQYDVVGNLGGASTFKNAWVEPITGLWKEIYVAYDADAAGQKGARKAATLLRGGDRSVHLVHIPTVGADVFDMVRGESSNREAMLAAIEGATQLGELNPHEIDDFIRTKCRDDDLQKDPSSLARALFQVMLDNGALFYHQDRREAYCSWRQKVYRVSGSDPEWNLLLDSYTGFFYSSNSGRQLHQNLSALACARGKPVEAGRWTHFDGEAMYFPLYDDEQRLVRITGDDISLVPNGWEDIVFLPNSRIPPITFQEDNVFNYEEAEKFYSSIWDHLNCSPKWQALVHALFRVFFMYDWMQTHPIVRFKGPAGSGKSTGQQFMSLLLYDDHNLLGEITRAGLYRQAMTSPVLLMDDLEDKNIRENSWLQTFFLRAAMGGKRIMSASDSQSDTVEQETRCWIVSSGIHSISDDNAALNERLLIVPVRERAESTHRFAAMQFFKEISKRRADLWNYIFRETQRMLHAIQDGALDRVVEKLPVDQRPRLHEAYGLMALARGSYDEPDSLVMDWLLSAAKGEQRALVESSHVSELLYYLPSYMGNGSENSGHYSARDFNFAEVTQDNGLWAMRVHANGLHAIMSKMAKDTGLRYWIPNSRRLASELQALSKAGEEEGISLQYDQKPRRIGGKVARTWIIEIDVGQVRPLPGLDFKDPPEKSEDDIPF